MAKKSADVKRFSAGVIVDFIHRVLVAAEMPSEDAHIVAKLMTEADVNGSDGHGVFRLPGYIQRIKEGGLNLRPNIQIEKDTFLESHLRLYPKLCKEVISYS